MSENLNGIQIQLLLYFLEAEPKKRTVTDAARYLNKPKSTLTHILDSLDELSLMERVEGRKSVLTAAGKRTAQELLHQRKILEQYRPQLDQVAQFLLQHETMTAQEFEDVFRSQA